MSSTPPPESPSPVMTGKQKLGWVVTGLGGALLLWGVLGFTSSSIGGPPDRREFASRRTYNQIKRASHEAMPWMMLRGFSGLALLYVGSRLRRSSNQESDALPEDDSKK